MKQFYKACKFIGRSLALIDIINGIVEEYSTRLTVRQLYYQLVSRGHIENTLKSYKCTASLINDARLAGLIDWDAIEDRTRSFKGRYHATSPKQSLENLAAAFHLDMWDNQEHRVFVIIEKEALAGVFQNVCFRYDVPLLAARGYPSASVLREFGEYNVKSATENGQDAILIHLGDHDPSGIDMTRDLDERIAMFAEASGVNLTRIALNMDQIRRQKPPPNPAKTTDARFKEYRKKFGTESWELDALRPDYLEELVETEIKKYIDADAWKEREAEIESVRARLRKVAKRFK